MRVRWTGWAGLEVQCGQATLIVDPLVNAAATFSALGAAAEHARLPEIRPPASESSLAGLLTHLHADHADLDALSIGLRPGAPVFAPVGIGGSGLESRSTIEAEGKLKAAGIGLKEVQSWQQVQIDPFTITALPAVDGLGDPQVSWLIQADGQRLLHLGDTILHGGFWRMALRHGPFDLVALPINGAVVDFPHRQPASPLPAVMDPEQAALAGDLLGARAVMPIHYDGYEIDPWYRPAPEALDRFLAATAGRPYATWVPALGESIELPAAE